jgi:hypothetical protein
LKIYLQDCDPDKKRYLLNGFRNGFSLEYTGSRIPYNYCRFKSAKDKPEVVQEKVDKEDACLRVMGPDKYKPFPNITVSPLELVPKK